MNTRAVRISSLLPLWSRAEVARSRRFGPVAMPFPPVVWLPYMSSTDERQKTTVYLDAEAYRRLKALARARGVAPAALVREAVAVYTATHAPARTPRSLGKGASARGDLSERAEDLLKGFGR